MKTILVVLVLTWAMAAPCGAQQLPIPSDSIFTDTMVEMSSAQVKAAAERGAVVIFPVAVVEEHGPHLDLSPDVCLTSLSARQVQWLLKTKGIEAVIAPPFYWGLNVSTGAFPGSFSVRPETMKAVLRDSFAYLADWGYRSVFLLNLHGDRAHRTAISELAGEYGGKGRIRAYDLANVNVASVPFHPPAAKPGAFQPDYHAGAHETKAMVDYYPARVNRQAAAKLPPQSAFAPLGYVGDPAGWKNGLGRELFEELARLYAGKIEVLARQK